ncbi:Acyl-ACP_TE domain-containing protein [Cephalotus follicularis]|uniref:Acyl-[acyl-carrier-protein] hydrolase n=1 Tax=Cephalotus follicularis TaxID=3775 RepID=A0A1Q3BSH3_CEPFO|nr:Acyl-ACP_TE domain-containing protein [Cephalotus follicularis]
MQDSLIDVHAKTLSVSHIGSDIYNNRTCTMLKVSCNVTDQNFTMVGQYRFMGPHENANGLRGKNAVVFTTPVGNKQRVVKAEGVLSDGRWVEPGTGIWADRLRLGSLADDGLSYKEKLMLVRLGVNKTATVETIANLLQEMSCNHIQSLGFSADGFGTSTIMRKLRIIWVTTRMHIEIYKYPAWSDVIEMETWFQREGKVEVRRNWMLTDYANGQVIGRATSKAVMMNQDTRRLQKVHDDVWNEFLVFSPKTLRLAFPEENNSSLKKLPKLRDPAQYARLGLMPRRAELDMNQHVNNVAYIGWVLESMPQDIIDTHELQTITLEYRRECRYADLVDSLTNPEPNEEAEVISELQGTNGSVIATGDKKDYCQFLHLLRFSGDGREINRGRTEWRKKPATAR